MLEINIHYVTYTGQIKNKLLSQLKYWRIGASILLHCSVGLECRKQHEKWHILGSLKNVIYISGQ